MGEINWMIDFNNDSKQKPINESSNNLLNFDFFESNVKVTEKGNSTNKITNNNNFNDMHDIFQVPEVSKNLANDNVSQKAFNFSQKQQPAINFNDFNFDIQGSNTLNKAKNDLKEDQNKNNLNRSKSPNNPIDNSNMNHYYNNNNSTSNKLNTGNNNNVNNNMTRSISPNVSQPKSGNTKQNQDIYDFFK